MVEPDIRGAGKEYKLCKTLRLSEKGGVFAILQRGKEENLQTPRSVKSFGVEKRKSYQK